VASTVQHDDETIKQKIHNGLPQAECFAIITNDDKHRMQDEESNRTGSVFQEKLEKNLEAKGS